MDSINAAYLVTAAISSLASIKYSSRTWLLISLGIVILEISRITHAAMSVDDYLEHVLRSAGLYDQRRPIQLACIAAFASSFVIFVRPLRHTRIRPQLIFVTGAFYILAVLMVVRASSLHWSDAFLERQLGSMTLSQAAQLLLLAMIAGGALYDLRQLSIWSQKRLDAS